MIEGLFIEIIKTGVATIVISRMAKAVGEKDMAEIVSVSGVSIIGIDIIKIVKPVVIGIQKAYDKIDITLDKWGKVTENLTKAGGWVGEFFKRGYVGN